MATTITIDLSQDERRECREIAGCERGDRRPVVVVPGRGRPVLAGHGCYYTTPGGRVIDHPSAYARAGGWHQVYHPSTRRVEVGEAWIRARRLRATGKALRAGAPTLALIAEVA